MNGADWFTRAFGAAVDDVRKRVVEELWFGRAVTPPLRPDHTVSDALGWTRASDTARHPTAAPEQGHGQGHGQSHDQNHDFER